MRISVRYNTMMVKNLEESVEFYKNILGFEETYHVDIPAKNQRITLMKSPDGGTVELIENPERPIGLWSVGTDVDNLDEVMKHLEARGIEHTPVVRTTVGHMCFINDPNQVRICLIEHDIKNV